MMYESLRVIITIQRLIHLPRLPSLVPAFPVTMLSHKPVVRTYEHSSCPPSGTCVNSLGTRVGSLPLTSMTSVEVRTDGLALRTKNETHRG